MLNQKEMVESFPVSRTQAQTLEVYAREARNSRVVVTWNTEVELATVRLIIEERIASQPMFGTAVILHEPVLESLQLVGSGRTTWVTSSHQSEFDTEMQRTFSMGDHESLRVIVQEGTEGNIVRLGLSAPPYVSDVDGLLRLLAIDENIDGLTFQHFSEWTLEQEDAVINVPIALTALDMRTLPGQGWQRRQALAADATPLAPFEFTQKAVAATSAVLIPFFCHDDHEVVSCMASIDGRIFDEFSTVAGPFRQDVTFQFPREIESASDFVAIIEENLERNLNSTLTASRPVAVSPECSITVIEVPTLHPLFQAAQLEVVADTSATLHVQIVGSALGISVRVISELAELDNATINDLATQILMAVQRIGLKDVKTVDQLSGRVFPMFPAIKAGTDTIIDLLQETVTRMPDSPAFITESTTHSFRDIDSAITALASQLVGQFEPGARVLIFADRSFDAVVAMLGTLYAGMVCVPILREHPDDRVRDIIRISAATGAIAQPSELERARRIEDLTVLPALGHPVANTAPIKISSSNTAYILFTSGSTGTPKGVAVAHHSVVNLLHALDKRIYGSTDAPIRLSVNAPLGFDASMKQFFQIALGKTLVPIPADVRADPFALIDYVEKMKIVALDVTPTILKAMIAAGFGSQPGTLPKNILVGGEAIGQDLWDTVSRWRGCDVWNVYGPTEATVNTLVAKIRDTSYTTLGFPLNNIHVAVVNAQGYEIPMGTVGELQIGGAGVALGYLGASAGENRNFSETSIGTRLYRSGDQVRKLADGSYEFLGRRDDQVKLTGQRFELGEVRTRILEQPDVANAAVFLDKRVEGIPRLVAAITARHSPEGGIALSATAVSTSLRSTLPPFMVPQVIAVVERIPMTPQGKLDQSGVLALLDEQENSTDAGTTTPVSLVADEQQLEPRERLLQIWRGVLRRPTLTINDDFFNNGGDSIRAILMQSKAVEAGIKISLRQLHATPTIVALIPVGEEVSIATAVPAELSTTKITPKAIPNTIRRWRPSSMQRVMLLSTISRKDAQVFHNATITTVNSPFDAERFRRALRDVKLAHPVLAARFSFEEGEFKFIHDPANIDSAYEYCDLRAYSPEVAEEMVAEHVRGLQGVHFHADMGELVRYAIFELTDDRFELMVEDHHATLDGYSLNALITELVRRAVGLEVNPTDDLAVYSALTADELAADSSPATEAFWKEQLGSLPANKPLAPPRARSQRADMRQSNVLISREIVSAIDRCSRREGISTKAILFGLHIETLTQVLGEKPTRIGVVFSLRPEVVHSLDAIGNFLNVLPVACTTTDDFLAEAQSFDRFDRSVFAHKAVSRERLSAWTGEASSFDAVFNFIQFAEPDPENGDVHEVERRYFAVDALVPVSADWDLSGDQLHLGFQYDAKRVNDLLVKRLEDAFRQAVQSFIEQERANTASARYAVKDQILSIIGNGLERKPALDDQLEALGLDSLKLVGLTCQLRDTLQIELDLTRLLSANTVAEIIALCEPAGIAPTSSFIELSAPKTSAPRVRIVSILPPGVAPGALDPWCDLVPEDVSVHAFKYTDFRTTEDLSFDSFMDQIVEALEPLTDQPIIMVGSCFGSVLAYEAGRRISRKPVAIVVFASPSPSLHGPDGPGFNYHNMTDREVSHELLRMAVMPEKDMQNRAVMASILPTLRGLSQIATGYRCQRLPTDSPIVSVWPKSDAITTQDQMEAWQTLTTDRFISLQMEGGHAVLMNDPERAYAAAGIQEILDAIEDPANMFVATLV